MIPDILFDVWWFLNDLCCFRMTAWWCSMMFADCWWFLSWESVAVEANTPWRQQPIPAVVSLACAGLSLIPRNRVEHVEPNSRASGVLSFPSQPSRLSPLRAHAVPLQVEVEHSAAGCLKGCSYGLSGKWKFYSSCPLKVQYPPN